MIIEKVWRPLVYLQVENVEIRFENSKTGTLTEAAPKLLEFWEENSQILLFWKDFKTEVATWTLSLSMSTILLYSQVNCNFQILMWNAARMDLIGKCCDSSKQKTFQNEPSMNSWYNLSRKSTAWTPIGLGVWQTLTFRTE